MATQPRTTRKRPKKPQNGINTNHAPDSSENIFDSTLNTISSLSVAQKVGLGVSAMALLSTAAIKLSASTKVSEIS